MPKILFFIMLLLTTVGCRTNSNGDSKTPDSLRTKDHPSKNLMDPSPKQAQKLRKGMQEDDITEVTISNFIDSLVNLKNVTLLETLTEEIDPENNSICYISDTRKFELKIIETDTTSNTLFYDGNKIIDFNNYSVLASNNAAYTSEKFGFNYRNKLENVRIIQIANKQFIYADITFDCNGKGCGCQLNFIYDIQNKTPFFIDNYRFPYRNYFLSDFNSDGIVDLLIIGRKKGTSLDGPENQGLAYQVTWFEYLNGEFHAKRKVNSEDLFSFEFGG